MNIHIYEGFASEGSTSICSAPEIINSFESFHSLIEHAFVHHLDGSGDSRRAWNYESYVSMIDHFLKCLIVHDVEWPQGFYNPLTSELSEPPLFGMVFLVLH